MLSEMGPSHLSQHWRKWLPSFLYVQLFFWSLIGILYLAMTTTGSDNFMHEAREAQVAAREKSSANVVKLKPGFQEFSGLDSRGWILSPLHMAAEHGLGGQFSYFDLFLFLFNKHLDQ